MEWKELEVALQGIQQQLSPLSQWHHWEVSFGYSNYNDLPQALTGCFKTFFFNAQWSISLERNMCPPVVQTASTSLVGWSLIRLSGYTFMFCLVVFFVFVFFLISDMTCSQRNTTHSLQTRGGFLSSFLSQSKKGPSRPPHPSGASPTQTGSMLLGKKEPTNHQVILNCVSWKVLSIQGINLQHSTALSFCFHL